MLALRLAKLVVTVSIPRKGASFRQRRQMEFLATSRQDGAGQVVSYPDLFDGNTIDSSQRIKAVPGLQSIEHRPSLRRNTGGW